jgi:phage head maturation protease
LYSRTRHRDDRRATHPSTVLRFLTFERLPLTPANRRLLEIQPVGRPTVTETSVSEIRAQQQHRPRPRKP